MNATKTKQVDLSTLSAAELKAELKRRETKKQDNIKAYKELVSDTVPVVVAQGRKISEELSRVKLELFETARDLLITKYDIYGIKTDQQSHTFTDEKGSGFKYGFRVNDRWDDTVNEGIALIGQVIEDFVTDDKSKKLVNIINRLLKRDDKGNLKSSRVLELRQMAYELNIPKFTEGVDIIQESYKPVRSVFFMEVWEVDKSGKKNYWSMSINSVDFPEGTNIDELFPTEKTKNDEKNRD